METDKRKRSQATLASQRWTCTKDWEDMERHLEELWVRNRWGDWQ